MKKLILLFLIITPQLCGMNVEDQLYTALCNKTLTTFGQAHNAIFYFSVQNQEKLYDEMYNVTRAAITRLKQNECFQIDDYIFFDPRSQDPMETWKTRYEWPTRDETYPQSHNDFKLIIYNIPDIACITDKFITLLENNINHHQQAKKNNILLNINSNLQHNPKLSELTRLLGKHNNSGNIEETPNNGYSVRHKCLMFGSLAALLGFLYYVISMR